MRVSPSARLVLFSPSTPCPLLFVCWLVCLFVWYCSRHPTKHYTLFNMFICVHSFLVLKIARYDFPRIFVSFLAISTSGSFLSLGISEQRCAQYHNHVYTYSVHAGGSFIIRKRFTAVLLLTGCTDGNACRHTCIIENSFHFSREFFIVMIGYFTFCDFVRFWCVSAY